MASTVTVFYNYNKLFLASTTMLSLIRSKTSVIDTIRGLVIDTCLAKFYWGHSYVGKLLDVLSCIQKQPQQTQKTRPWDKCLFNYIVFYDVSPFRVRYFFHIGKCGSISKRTSKISFSPCDLLIFTPCKPKRVCSPASPIGATNVFVIFETTGRILM